MSNQKKNVSRGQPQPRSDTIYEEVARIRENLALRIKIQSGLTTGSSITTNNQPTTYRPLREKVAG